MITLDWIDFAEEIKFNNRFFPESSKLLQAVNEIFDKHVETIETGTKFYRARLIELNNMNVKDDILSGFPKKESLAPDAQLSTAQRASPEKISYLYAAEDEYTALSETRPGILSFISLAELESIEELKVLDLWIDINVPNKNSDHSELASRFSAVIAEKEKGIDYLPMQFVAEYVKSKGADGIRYTSFQSQGGKNIVIFRKEKVRYLLSKIMYNQNVAYSFLDITNPERKPVINSLELSALPKDFSEHIKSAVLVIQSKKH